MIIEETDQQKNPEIAAIVAVTHPDCDEGTSCLRPKCLFPSEDVPIDCLEKSAEVKAAKKRKIIADTRTRVYTDKGKPFLSSNIHLHIHKIQHQKSQQEDIPENDDCSDEEFLLLEKEAKRLEEKMEKHIEIRRLQLEL